MAQAVLRYAFVALLALFSTQVVAPSPRIFTAIESVRTAAAERQAPRQARPEYAPVARPQAAAPFASRIRPEPDSAVLFQRPPPTLALFA